MNQQLGAGRAATYILFIDDDFEDFEIFREAFQQVSPEGHIIHQRDCRTALNFLRNRTAHTPDYIFLDINMPIMTGDECLKELKADAFLRNIPVIMFSTSMASHDREKYKTLGAAKSLVKPTRFADVVRIIQDLKL